MNTSIKKIKQSYPKQETLSFREIRQTETLEIIKSFPKNKATVFKDIPMRIIKSAAHVYSRRLTIILKRDTTDKSNYRPTGTLSNFLKIFEKLIYNQVNSYMESKLSKYLVGFY